MGGWLESQLLKEEFQIALTLWPTGVRERPQFLAVECFLHDMLRRELDRQYRPEVLDNIAGVQFAVVGVSGLRQSLPHDGLTGIGCGGAQ